MYEIRIHAILENGEIMNHVKYVQYVSEIRHMCTAYVHVCKDTHVYLFHYSRSLVTIIESEHH